MALPSADELRGQSCSLLGGCSSDTPSIPKEQLQQYLAALPAWHLSEDQQSISRRFVAKNFVSAIDFFNAVKEVAEAENHHPDLHLTNYREVQVVLSTHAIKALSILDMVMAAKIDGLPVQYSPKWERENKAKLGQS